MVIPDYLWNIGKGAITLAITFMCWLWLQNEEHKAQALERNTQQATISANALINLNHHLDDVKKNQRRQEDIMSQIAKNDAKQDEDINFIKTELRLQCERNKFYGKWTSVDCSPRKQR